MSSPGSLLLFCTAWQQDTFSAYDQSYTFAQPAVQTARWSYCAFRRVCLAIIAKLSQNRVVQLLDYGC